MRVYAYRFLMMAALGLTLALSACYPEEKDPDQSSDAGQLSGSFFASALGNTAVRLQDLIVNDPNWFQNTTASWEMILANYNIEPNLPAQIRSYVCPTGTGTEVRQITWIDGRNAQGNFNVMGVGTEAGAIVSALRELVAGAQVGVYTSNSTIELSSGQQLSVPPSCAGIDVPLGAPVIAFTIIRPAAPSQELARTEYRTVGCGVDSGGVERRGTLVQSRVVRYLADGTVLYGGWGTENMGNCIDDVTVDIVNRTPLDRQSNPQLDNFAAIALRNLLAAQLAEMDCLSVQVTSSMVEQNTGNRENQTKSINTCATVRPDGTHVISDTDIANNVDSRGISCVGTPPTTSLYAMGLVNPGTATSSAWWGGGTVVRTTDNRNLNSGEGSRNARQIWSGETLSCARQQFFYGNCTDIPNQPSIGPRNDGDKYEYVYESQVTSEGGNWFVDDLLGCHFGGCNNYSVTNWITMLNPNYFTGGGMTRNNGVTGWRYATVNGWSSPTTLTPNGEQYHGWTDVVADCAWGDRTLEINCGAVTGSYGGWQPGYMDHRLVFYPSIRGGRNQNTWWDESVNSYQRARTYGNHPARVSVYVVDEGWDDDSYWASYGPGLWPGFINDVRSGWIQRSPWEPSGPTWQRTLWNTDGILIEYRPYWNGSGWVVSEAGFAETVVCSEAWRSIVNLTYRYHWQEMVGWTPHPWPYGTYVYEDRYYDVPEEMIQITMREWAGTGYNNGTWSKTVYWYMPASALGWEDSYYWFAADHPTVPAAGSGPHDSPPGIIQVEGYPPGYE